MKTWKEISQIMAEAKKSDYEIYHDSYTKAIQEVEKYVKKRGFILDDDEMFHTIGAGPAKPGAGKTNKFSLKLYKSTKDLADDKPQKKMLHVQVYGMGTGKHLSADKYELNLYIS